MSPTYRATHQLIVDAMAKGILQGVSLENPTFGGRAQRTAFKGYGKVVPKKKIPTAVFHGTEDQIIPINEATTLAEVYNARLFTYPGCGHLLLAEPSPFGKDYREFLSQH
jgi:pimeloyl-ACP methyl ester carboxylesterase